MWVRAKLRCGASLDSAKPQGTSMMMHLPHALPPVPIHGTSRAVRHCFLLHILNTECSQCLSFMPQEPELDDLVGKLLCGSMESMLFEKNDDLFVARTSSLMSVSSATTPRNYSSCGESTDMSSDDETLHDSACSTPRKTATAWLFGLDTGCSDLRSQAGSWNSTKHYDSTSYLAVLCIQDGDNFPTRTSGHVSSMIAIDHFVLFQFNS